MIDFGSTTRTIDVDPDGDWNAVEFFISARNGGNKNNPADRLLSSTSTINIDEVNGQTSVGFSQSATDGTFSGIFALDEFGSISSLSGTMSFDFVVSGNNNASPGGLLAVNVKALEVAPIPVPPALALGGLALAGLGLYARRQRRAART